MRVSVKIFPSFSFFSPLNVAGVLKKKIPNLYQHLSSFTTFTVPFIKEIISPIDVSTSFLLSRTKQTVDLIDIFHILHKNDSTAQVGEFRKLFFLKDTYGIQTKITNLSLKKHFPHLNSKGHVIDDASTSERPSKNSTKVCDGICRKSQQLLFFLFQICQRILSILEINICFSRQ